MYNPHSLKATEFIDHQEILDTLAYADAHKDDLELVDAILDKAAQCKGLSHREASVLLACEDEMRLQRMYDLAKEIKLKFYGNRIVLFAPLYLSNYCVNGCVYCPYHAKNKHIGRKKLTQEEVAREVIALQDMGHKRLAIEAGEDPKNNPIEYILECIKTIYSIHHKNGDIRRVNVNIAATTVEEYRMLKVYDVPESQLAQMLENWEDALKEGLKLAYLPSPGLVRLRITAKGESVKHLDECYESLKEVLKDVRYAEGDDVLEKQLGELLRNKKVTMATAESCTGGYIAHLITSIAGSSDYFKGSVVSYANEVKVNVLGVNAADLEREGAVSEAVVLQMAEGVRKITGADYAVSTSGVAGPGGGTPEKPVGTVWIGVATPRKSYAKLFTFSFTRERNIAKAASKAMEMLLEEVRENEK